MALELVHILVFFFFQEKKKELAVLDKYGEGRGKEGAEETFRICKHEKINKILGDK